MPPHNPTSAIHTNGAFALSIASSTNSARVAPRVNTAPVASAATISLVSRASTSPSTPRGVAPRAIRMPNSRVRCATDWLMTLKIPVPASSSAINANPPSMYPTTCRDSDSWKPTSSAMTAGWGRGVPAGVSTAAAIARRTPCGSVVTCASTTAFSPSGP